jgi:hypothetical protein
MALAFRVHWSLSLTILTAAVVRSDKNSPEAMGFSKANFDKVCVFTIFVARRPSSLLVGPESHGWLLRETIAAWKN